MNWKKWIWPVVILALAIGLITVITGKNDGREKKPAGQGITEEEQPEEVLYRYGLAVDSFKTEEYTIRRDQNLSEILLARGISYARIDELARTSKPVFDVRKMKAGQPCVFFYRQDSSEALAHMVYEKDREHFVVYSFGDSIRISEGKKKSSTEERYVEGTIESNLWNALADLQVSTRLAIDLSDIYAWTVDFFGIQQGDRFKIIYTVRLIEGEAIGVDEIKAASFYHGEKMHYAFQFEQDGVRSYFDETGQSLRRAFLKAPLNFRRISSGYSNSRLHPILRVYRPHRGIDYAADQGTPVVSIGDGKVVKIAYDRASGHYLKIKHNAVYTSGYLHLMEKPRGLQVGDYVSQGQQIGRVGKTGYATGPHLDFRIWKNGELVNPLRVESPPVEPVAEANRVRFDSLRRTYENRLTEAVLTFTQ